MYGLLIRSPRKRDGGMNPLSSTKHLFYNESFSSLLLLLLLQSPPLDGLTDKSGKMGNRLREGGWLPPTWDPLFDKGNNAATCGNKQPFMAMTLTRVSDMRHMFSMHATCEELGRVG